MEIIKRREQRALIIVHRSELAKQWAAIIEERMGIKAGFIGDGEWSIGDQITVAMVQTLATRENETKALDFYANDADISIPVLVSLVLKDKCGKSIKENHSFDLKLRGYIDNESNITKEGKSYLETDRTKNRIKKILNY